MAHRFFVNPDQIINDKVEILGDDYRHLVRVLRIQLGEIILVTAGMGSTYRAKVNKIDDSKVIGEIIEKLEVNTESPVALTLFQGLAKGDKMDLVIQKAVELGVTKIVPFFSERTVVKLDVKKEEKRVERWQRIAKEAAKQNQREIIPTVSSPSTINEMVEYVKQKDATELFLVPYELEEKQGLKDLEIVPPPQAISIAIGPEGGFSVPEIDQLVEAGATTITLGPRILRTETAGLVALALVGYKWGDLG